MKNQYAICKGFIHWVKGFPERNKAKPRNEKKKDCRVNITKETSSGDAIGYSLVVTSSTSSNTSS